MSPWFVGSKTQTQLPGLRTKRLKPVRQLNIGLGSGVCSLGSPSRLDPNATSAHLLEAPAVPKAITHLSNIHCLKELLKKRDGNP